MRRTAAEMNPEAAGTGGTVAQLAALLFPQEP
jgi:hypothetical protein